MLLTLFVVAVLLGGQILQVVLWSAFLCLGLRWAKVNGVTTGRIAVVTLIVWTIQIGISVFSLLVEPLLGAAILIPGITVFPCLVISRAFKARTLQSIQAWLATLLSAVVSVVIALAIVRPFLFEAFVVPSNAMAPTILGNTWRSTCPECGHVNYCSPVESRSLPQEGVRMICDQFHANEIMNVDLSIFPPDRFLVTKFIAPQRWDVVVFRYPADPATTYMMRLVGLPGETIHIENGAVWANGVKLDPPHALLGIDYSTDTFDSEVEVFGAKDRPADLDSDEYFVLGDFSARSNDSRFWKRGATGHNPFAVPKSHLIGVVTQTYWPPERWKIFR